MSNALQNGPSNNHYLFRSNIDINRNQSEGYLVFYTKDL